MERLCGVLLCLEHGAMERTEHLFGVWNLALHNYTCSRCIKFYLYRLGRAPVGRVGCAHAHTHTTHIPRTPTFVRRRR